nr:protein SWEETIE isoform X1 [Tanacetum cinerariifolium]
MWNDSRESSRRGRSKRSFPDDMSPGNMCHRDTYFLIGKYVGPTVSPGLSLGKESLTSVPQRTISDDKSPGKSIPSDKSPGKAGICRWGRGLIRLHLKQHFNGQCTRSGGVSLLGDMESLEIAHIPDKTPFPLHQLPTVSVYAADSSGMLSLLSTLEHSLKSGKKHGLHATSVVNVYMGLLFGLKAIFTLRSQPLEMELLNALQGIFQSILVEGGISESQRRASSDGLGLLARLGNDMFTVRLASSYTLF